LLLIINNSGNVTPIPTTGELDKLSPGEEKVIPGESRPKSQQESRATPLKSLLKKPSIDYADICSSSSDSDCEDGKVSPRKVHFSEYDQVKLMSQDSLASMATSEGSDVTIIPATNCSTFLTSGPTHLC
jgi:hypothetical protein